MLPGRLMGSRALTLLPPPGATIAVAPCMKTNGARLRLMPTDNDDRPTTPPSAPPPGMYTDTVVDDLLATAKRLEGHYKALLDPEGLLTKQTATISTLIDTNFRLIHEQFRGLVKSVDAVTIRVGHIETSQEQLATNQESSAERLERMELDMAAMKHQVDRMDAELGEFRRAMATSRQP